MSQSNHQHQQADATSEPPQQRWVPQLTLSTLMIVMAVICMVTAWWQLRLRNQRLETQIAAMSLLAPSIQIENPSQYAAVRRTLEWYDESIWDVYLPPGNEYRVCLGTDKLRGEEKAAAVPPEVVAEYEISSGQYEFELKSETTSEESNVQVFVDGKTIIDYSEAENWNVRGTSSGGANWTVATQQTTDKPFTLYLRRFHPPKGGLSTEDAAKGIKVWIEVAE